MKQITLATLALSTLISFTGCSPQLTNSPLLTPSSQPEVSTWFKAINPSELKSILVLSALNQPVPHAQILVGTELNQPFAQNLLETDEFGIAIVPAEWQSATAITIQAEGFVRQTLLNQLPGDLIIKLKFKPLTSKPLLKGQVTQLPVVNGDKQTDFSLVLPTVARKDLLSFSLDSVISAENDKITLVGQEVEIPSNVSLPTQKESYILPLTLSKPEYRLYAQQLGPQTFYALSGQFPFKPVVKEFMDGKKFYEVINQFNFTTGSMRDLNIVTGLNSLNIPSQDLKFSQKLTVKGSAAAEDEVVLSLAVNELNGQFVPTDVKQFNPSQEGQLKTLNQASAYVVQLLKKKADFAAKNAAFDRSTISILAYQPQAQAQFIPLLNQPTISLTARQQIRIDWPLPTALNKINALAQSLMITSADGAPEWEVLGLGWEPVLTLPVFPNANSADGTQNLMLKNIQLNLIGSLTHQSATLGDDLVKAATHVSQVQMQAQLP